MKYQNLIQGLYKIGAEEGVGLRGIFKGYAGTVGLHSTYSMVRYGTYEPIKRLYGADDPKNTPIWKKFAAGGTAGFIAAGFACPVDLIKTRMQGQATGVSKSFGWHVKDLYCNHGGAGGFYKGLRSTLARGFLANSSYLGSYDSIKHLIMD